MQRLIFHTLVLVFVLAVVGQILFSSTQAPGEAQEAQALMFGDGRSSPAADGEETVIARDASGQFHVKVRVNGEETEFLVDTGADVVALTVDEAERLGLEVAPEDFRPIMQTASGVGKGARVALERLELGDEEFRDIDAVVVDGLHVNLLGQSALRRLGKVELQGDRMVIAHR